MGFQVVVVGADRTCGKQGIGGHGTGVCSVMLRGCCTYAMLVFIRTLRGGAQRHMMSSEQWAIPCGGSCREGRCIRCGKGAISLSVAQRST